MTRPVARVRAAAIVGTTAVLAADSPATEMTEPVALLQLRVEVDAAAQCLLIADDASAAQWGTALPVNARPGGVLDAVTATAAEPPLDAPFVYPLVRDQIDATGGSRVRPVRAVDARSRDRTDHPHCLRLGRDRSLNHTMVTEIAEQWDTPHTPNSEHR
ncbi:hypothetical protein LQL77_30580 [Rhodococcus cerastii]|nr:hypothetical protein [Rhodococcus cerastii]